MLCRQVIPDKKNGIEQIYIVKSENEPESQNTTDGLAGATSAMEPEDVEVKQEQPSDGEEDERDSEEIPLAANPFFNMLDVIIKEEPDEQEGESGGKASPVAAGSSTTKRVKTESVKQEAKGVKSDGSDSETEDSDSDWSEKHKTKAKRKSKSDDDSSDSSSRKNRKPVSRRMTELKKLKSDDDSSDSSSVKDRKPAARRMMELKKLKSEDDDSSRSSGVIDPEPIPRKEGKKVYNKRKKYPEDPPIRQNVIRRFVCHYCPKKFSTLYNRLRHEKAHEEHIPPEQRVHRKQNYCYICEREHSTKDDLVTHLCEHANMIPYTCTECEVPIKLSSVRLLNKHVECHKQTGIIKCRYCAAPFHSMSGCQQHEKGHVDKDKLEEAEARVEIESKRLNVKILIVDGLKRYECDYCKKSYTLLATLRRHVNGHTNTNTYQCKTCGKVFNHSTSLLLHEKVHTDFAPYKCETCGKGFKEVVRLIEHRPLHTGDKPYACHCGLSFIKKGGLSKHQRKCDIPENLESCTCRFCQVSFSSYLGMIRHVQEVHAPGMEDTMCRFCSVKFKDAVQLASHELRHELPGAIKCTQCTRIFKNKFNLDVHMQTHESAFMCHVCGKTFLHNVNLRVHRRVHSDRRPHVCDLCAMTFNCPASMRKHRLTHYNPASRNYIAGLVDEPVVEIRDDEEEEEQDEEEDIDEEDVEDEDIGVDEDLDVNEVQPGIISMKPAVMPSSSSQGP